MLFQVAFRATVTREPNVVLARHRIMRNSVVEHRSAESEGLGFRTLWGLRYFLCLTIATRKITSLSIHTSLLVRLLQTAQGSLLDDEQLVNTLNSSKTTSQEVAEQLQVSEQTEIKIDAAREVLILFTLRYKSIFLYSPNVFFLHMIIFLNSTWSVIPLQGYRPCAQRASILFFVLNDMGKIDPMYQFSLDAYIDLFNNSIEKSQRSPNLEIRIQNLNDYHTYAVYK